MQDSEQPPEKPPDKPSVMPSTPEKESNNNVCLPESPVREPTPPQPVPSPPPPLLHVRTEHELMLDLYAADSDSDLETDLSTDKEKRLLSSPTRPVIEDALSEDKNGSGKDDVDAAPSETVVKSDPESSGTNGLRVLGTLGPLSPVIPLPEIISESTGNIIMYD